MLFYVDAMLGNVGRSLRILGYDTLIADANISDNAIMDTALKTNRILITSDILFHEKYCKKRTVDGLQANSVLISEKNHITQLVNIFKSLNIIPSILESMIPNEMVKRCTKCNGMLNRVRKSKVKNLIRKKTYEKHNEFWQCSNLAGCNQIFWIGSHWENILKFFEKVRSKL